MKGTFILPWILQLCRRLSTVKSIVLEFHEENPWHLDNKNRLSDSKSRYRQTQESEMTLKVEHHLKKLIITSAKILRKF